MVVALNSNRLLSNVFATANKGQKYEVALMKY